MNQVFTYLIIILVVGLIAIFGYKGISSILKTNCEHQRISFEKSLLGFIDEHSDYGSVHEEVIRAPCDAEEVCFIDAKHFNGIPLSLIGDAVIDSAISDWREKTANIFVKAEFTEAIGYSDKVKLNDIESYKCFKVSGGSFKFLFTGLGRQTRIELP